MPNELKSNLKLFANDTCTFSIDKKTKWQCQDHTHDLSLISRLAFKWKMFFNPDSTKPAQEVIF